MNPFSKKRYSGLIIKQLSKIAQTLSDNSFSGSVPVQDRAMLTILADNTSLLKIEDLCRFMVSINSSTLVSTFIRWYGLDITTAPEVAKYLYDWFEIKDTNQKQRLIDFKKLESFTRADKRKEFIAVFITTFAIVYRRSNLITGLVTLWKRMKPDEVPDIPENLSVEEKPEFYMRELLKLYCGAGKYPQTCSYLLLIAVRYGRSDTFMFLFKILFEEFKYTGPICEGAVRELVKQRKSHILREFFERYGDQVLPWLGKRKRTVWKSGRYTPLSPTWFQKIVLFPLLLSNSIHCVVWACSFGKRYFTPDSLKRLIQNTMVDLSKERRLLKIRPIVYIYIHRVLMQICNNDFLEENIQGTPLMRCLEWYRRSTGLMLLFTG